MRFLFAKTNILAVLILTTVLVVFALADESKVEGQYKKADVGLVAQPTITESKTEPFKPKRIVMEKAGIDLPVIPVNLINGTWAVNEGVANFAEGTSLVDESGGNVGIYGHARPQEFLNIKNLTGGDTIVVYGQKYKALYQVESSDKITPSDVEAFYPSEDPTLTLITCEGVFNEYRYRVKASLIKIEKL
jgi:LPXTG-site transpeptidase (sortase) family protein